MMEFLITDESSCSCSLLKKSMITKELSISGNKDSKVLLLMAMPYMDNIKKIFMNFIKKLGYTNENLAQLNALGCAPVEFDTNDISGNYIQCKYNNIEKKIKELSPKVIITEGTALHTIVEKTYVKYNFFLNYKFFPTFFWSREFNCWILPIPPILTWIIPNVRDTIVLESLDNFMRFITRFQFMKIETILNTKPRNTPIKKVIVEDPIAFLKEHMNDNIEKIVVDIETTGLVYYRDKIFSIQLCWDRGVGYFIDWTDNPEFIQLLNEFLKNKYLIGSNFKFDTEFLRYNGVKDIKFSFDTNYAGHFLASYRGNSLKALTFYFTDLGGYENKLNAYKRQYKITDYSDVPKEIMTEYAIMDTVAAFRLEPILLKYMTEKQKNLFFNIYIPLVNLFVKIEMKGININVENLISLREDYLKRCNSIEEKIHEDFPDINLNSTYDLAEMFKRLKAKGYLVIKSGVFSTAEKVLHKWVADGVKFASEVLEYKKYHTSVKMFLADKAGLLSNINPEDGRVHSSFNFQKNWVGRLSGSSPNLQQLPIKSDINFRKVFTPKHGYYLAECDYSGFHLRLVAIASGDPVMQNIFKSNNKDMHSKTASFLFTDYTFEEFVDRLRNGTKEEKVKLKEYRNEIKPVNFGLIYGMEYYKLAHDILMHPKDGWNVDKIDSFLFLNNIGEKDVFDLLNKLKPKRVTEEELLVYKYEAAAKLIRQKFFAEYKGVEQWINRMHEEGKEKGYVETDYGFRIYFPEYTYPSDSGRKKEYSNLRNVSVNGHIIGLEANIMQETQLLLDEFFTKNKYDAYMVNQIHDSVLLEFKEDLLDELREPVKKIMSRDLEIYKGIPIAAEGHYGKIWGGNEEYPWNLWFEE